MLICPEAAAQRVRQMADLRRWISTSAERRIGAVRQSLQCKLPRTASRVETRASTCRCRRSGLGWARDRVLQVEDAEVRIGAGCGLQRSAQTRHFRIGVVGLPSNSGLVCQHPHSLWHVLHWHGQLQPRRREIHVPGRQPAQPGELLLHEGHQHAGGFGATPTAHRARESARRPWRVPRRPLGSAARCRARRPHP